MPELMLNPYPMIRVRRSVFVKLVTIMVTMALSLLIIVSVFFWMVGGPSLVASVERLVKEYARAVAASSPDLDAAKHFAARMQQGGANIDLQVRHEGGTAGDWTTDAEMPTIAQVQSGSRAGWPDSTWGRDYYVVPAPGENGGTYLFSWQIRGRVHTAHMTLLYWLLGLMVSIVAIAHVILERALRPLRTLGDGVQRLSDGQLDVVLPNPTHDEFGALTDAFNHMVRRVGDMVRARDQLLLDVSHELRSPLTRLKVALELLPPDERRNRMAADVAEMEAMIAELLELERLREGRGLVTERQDLVPLIRDVAARFADRPPGVSVTTSEPELPIAIDGEKIRTVLRNVLENAIKYSLPDSREVKVYATQNADTVIVRVTDDGPGIPDSDIASLFEPFFRVDRSRSKKTGGYGLGLSICKRIMQAHGGDIAVENVGGQGGGRGASFILTLRRDEPPAH
jgi:signal transduction histidine kinase